MSSSIHKISCSSGGFYSGTGSDVYITIYCIFQTYLSLRTARFVENWPTIRLQDPHLSIATHLSPLK